MTAEDLQATSVVRYEGKLLNVRQRKLQVMLHCDIKPDKRHSLGFEYVSIQKLSNELRTLCAEAGLDIEFTFPMDDPGHVELCLVNADEPSDVICTRWPVIEGDKGWAYTVKYPLVRLFLVGDAEENDEAEMANRSADAAKAPSRARFPEPPRWEPPKADSGSMLPPRARPPRGRFHMGDAA